MPPVSVLSVADRRKCLVTGGASGLGLRIAETLAAVGVSVAVGDVALDRLEVVARDNPRLLPVNLDVRESASVEAAVERCIRELGGLDTLIHAAGVIHVKPVEEVTDAEWDATIAVNLSGAFRLVRAAAPWLRKSGRGRIVSIVSGAGFRGYPWLQAYCASKFGLVGMSQSLAAELASDQVTVNCVAPGACPFTGMGRMLTGWKAELSGRSEGEVLDSLSASSVLGRYADEDDVAGAVLYLVSDQASYVTGTTIDVTGGEHLGLISGASSRLGSGFERS